MVNLRLCKTARLRDSETARLRDCDSGFRIILRPRLKRFYQFQAQDSNFELMVQIELNKNDQECHWKLAKAHQYTALSCYTVLIY